MTHQQALASFVGGRSLAISGVKGNRCLAGVKEPFGLPAALRILCEGATELKQRQRLW
jgi:hypothetical protein